MKCRRLFGFVVLWWLVLFDVQAQILVLVHGYLGSGSSWRLSGVTHMLSRAGWEDGGYLRVQDNQVTDYHHVSGKDKTFYTLDMPSEAAVLVQAKVLAKFMKFIGRKHPGESLSIAGFSAGGLIGRTYMVMRKKDEPRVAMLVTIATPHLGTGLAEVGRKLRQTPLSWVMPFVGVNSFNRSDVLFKDMEPEEAGNFLYWLNRQLHPKARYVSIIKSSQGGHFVVPAYSQNMNNVVALWGRSSIAYSIGGHRLSYQDALLLVRLTLVDPLI